MCTVLSTRGHPRVPVVSSRFGGCTSLVCSTVLCTELYCTGSRASATQEHPRAITRKYRAPMVIVETYLWGIVQGCQSRISNTYHGIPLLFPYFCIPPGVKHTCLGATPVDTIAHWKAKPSICVVAGEGQHVQARG